MDWSNPEYSENNPHDGKYEIESKDDEVEFVTTWGPVHDGDRVPFPSSNFPDVPANMFFRTGYPHNMLFVIPEWNMVIVRLCEGYDGRPDIDRPVLWNRVLQIIGEGVEDVP